MKHRQKILDLKPTQFAVGMLEIDEKIKIVQGYGNRQRRDYIDDNPVPVVIGPHRDLYIVDHHHFLSVCYHVGIKKVRITPIKNMSRSGMTYGEFWKWMAKNRSVYPFCQFGEGPRKPLYLPKDIRGLADDPYRSLAWFVRKAGAFENSDRNFAEFQWANFFRSKGLLDRHGPRGMPAALIKAAALAQSPEAKHLPGFGKLNLHDKATVTQKLKHKGKKLKPDVA